MPYINIIIPRERVYLSDTIFFDTLDEYVIGFKDDTFYFNENILNFEENEKRGLVNGRLFWLNNYSYNDFNIYNTGTSSSFAFGYSVFSGYNQFTGLTTGTTF